MEMDGATESQPWLVLAMKCSGQRCGPENFGGVPEIGGPQCTQQILIGTYRMVSSVLGDGDSVKQEPVMPCSS